MVSTDRDSDRGGNESGEDDNGGGEETHSGLAWRRRRGGICE